MVKALAAAILSAVATSLVVVAIWDQSVLSTGGVIFFCIYGIPIAGTAALTVGVPAHLLLSRFRVRSLVAYLLAGVIAALAFGVWMERLPVTPHPVSWSQALSAAVFALPGALVAAAVFWRLAVRPRLTSQF